MSTKKRSSQKRTQKRKLTQVPTGAIEYFVGNRHVGTPDAEIRAEFERRCRKAGGSEALVKKCGDVAVKAHQENRKLYTDVMRGKIR